MNVAPCSGVYLSQTFDAVTFVFNSGLVVAAACTVTTYTVNELYLYCNKKMLWDLFIVKDVNVDVGQVQISTKPFVFSYQKIHKCQMFNCSRFTNIRNWIWQRSLDQTPSDFTVDSVKSKRLCVRTPSRKYSLSTLCYFI